MNRKVYCNLPNEIILTLETQVRYACFQCKVKGKPKRKTQSPSPCRFKCFYSIHFFIFFNFHTPISKPPFCFLAFTTLKSPIPISRYSIPISSLLSYLQVSAPNSAAFKPQFFFLYPCMRKNSTFFSLNRNRHKIHQS